MSRLPYRSLLQRVCVDALSDRPMVSARLLPLHVVQGWLRLHRRWGVDLLHRRVLTLSAEDVYELPGWSLLQRCVLSASPLPTE